MKELQKHNADLKHERLYTGDPAGVLCDDCATEMIFPNALIVCSIVAGDIFSKFEDPQVRERKVVCPRCQRGGIKLEVTDVPPADE